MGKLFTALILLTLGLNLWADDKPTMMHKLTGLKTFFSSNSFTSYNCSFLLTNTFIELFTLTPQSFERRNLEDDAINIVSQSVKVRLTLRERLKEFYQKGKLNEACAREATNVYRALRTIEDFAGGWYLRIWNEIDREHPPVLGDEAPWTQSNPRFGTFNRLKDIRSGDVILSHGVTSVHAAIARLADVDTQFSHLAMVYIDKKSGKKYTIEAYMRNGSNVYSYTKDYLHAHMARAVVFRHSDADLAHKAAKFIYNHVKEAVKKKAPIKYDITMDMDDHSGLFCSEVIRFAFRHASKGKMMVPLFPSKFDNANKEFLSKLDIKVKRSFIPADIEIDPRFELVAEWRDYSINHETRIKDAVLTMMYKWMQDEKYRLRGSVRSWILKNIAWGIRRVPLLGMALAHRFPTYMKRDVLSTIAIVDQIEGILEEEMKKRANLHFKKTGFTLTPLQMYQELEKIRLEDKKKYLIEIKRRRNRSKSEKRILKKSGRSIFHKYFRPDNLQ
jgi:hypothetical protein